MVADGGVTLATVPPSRAGEGGASDYLTEGAIAAVVSATNGRHVVHGTLVGELAETLSLQAALPRRTEDALA